METKTIALSEKISLFASKFPSAEDDLNLNLDAKHKLVVQDFLRQGGLSGINLKNLRNWKGQNDLGAPATLKYLLRRENFSLRELINLVLSKTVRYSSTRALRDSMDDDLYILKQSGAYEILVRNPVSESKGSTRWVSDRKTTYNMRWLRYAYLANRILSLNLINRDSIWVDIGSFYGGLQSIVHRENKNSRKILVDFHHQLLRSYLFLSSTYPEANHILGYEPGQEIPEGSFVYVPVQQFTNLQNLKVDLVSNFFSFGEMPREIFEEYRDSQLIRNASYVYNVNRFVSSPFFEKTYDTDLNVFDYIVGNHIKIYFDIFPMHHYQAIRRNLFGKTRLRNTSSSYFEMISRAQQQSTS